MPIGPARMPFMEHIRELRNRLAVIVAVVAPLILGLYFSAEPIYAFLIAPVAHIIAQEGSPLGENAVVLRVFDAMMLKFKVAMFGGIILGSPLIIWQTMAFFLPALKERERKFVLPTFFAMVVLFVGGAAFCYYAILGPGFEWLIGQTGGIFTYVPTGPDLITSILWFLFGFGLAFQTPVIVFYLTFFGIVPYATLRKNWRQAWIVIIIVAAAATPDWSPFNMVALSAAMIVLYEASLLLVRIVLRKKIAQQKAEEAA